MKATKYFLFSITLLLLTSCTIYDNEIDTEIDLVYSDTITILASDFVAEDEYVSVAEYGWDNLDEFLVDEGLVLGYLRFEGTTAWQALPFAVPFENDFVNLRYLFDINNFSLVIEGEVPDNNEVNAELFNGDVLRIIAIPPAQIVQGKGIDYNNYEQVAKIYNLEK
ncbi:MAG: hypothetical protein WD016_05525 [Balneolaceae bacterium]